MVIQCKTCKTRYRFDESVIAGEGIWVRCTRCEQVFFQSSPYPRERFEPEPSPDSDLPDRFETIGGEPWRGEKAMEVEEDERFIRDGADLIHELNLTFTQAALGAELEIPTVDGTARIRVPDLIPGCRYSK